ncbi:MAG: L,D-transpeptidase [Pseudotabrizicola sp.]|uniref:L,D-transpeptidase n=1 Tax=Pseudotabrizicola sp. TaxID=2939647 RepID=UPI0027229098|nr:L,D-transpeptidase [Pseudotabrizicola sp.]MDO8884123.1 L,D-transpeptidase [Pseudotabrizicola sp.]MDP2080064.1 L,D-transpeptidase [Pseudotabrizicola sp.]MDZ7575510.1 L,D-transpeptidase [Pseudotabrizicola sp.]
MRKLLACLSIVLLGLVSVPALATQKLPSAPDLHVVEYQAKILVRVSISRQMMDVYHEGRKVHEWPVSTARQGKITPTGQWKGAQWLSRNHRSSLYNNAPMPYAIFYNGNYAIHGTDQVKKLGRPASAGCVRLHTANAKVLFNMVRDEGKDALRVVVVR